MGIDKDRYMRCVVAFSTLLTTFRKAETVEERQEIVDLLMFYLLSVEGRYFMRMCPPSLQASIRAKFVGLDAR